MSESEQALEAHPAGDGPSTARELAREAVKVDTFGGTVHVEWDPDVAATPLGHLAFFAEYLKVSGRFDALVADCPLHYTSPNAPSKRDILGTVMLSALAGHWRYAHITALRGDGVNPSLLGMTKVASEDSVRRALERIPADEGASWLHGHLDDTVRPLLSEPWVLDCDTTIKPLYGHQEGAVVSYNPKKPGRPSHAYHAFLMAGTRLVLDVDVAPGDRHHSKHAAPSLWALLDRLGRENWPRLVRGDKDWGNEGNMASCEAVGLDYLFKLRLTKGARQLAERLAGRDGWQDAGQGWWGIEAELRLHGWSRTRRVVVLRRLMPGTVALTRSDDGQGDLFWADAKPGTSVWEFAVLATSLDLEVRSIAQLYRDRADAENGFDQLKNQWGWGGFTTRDLKRCQHMARLIALIYNWWSLFVRLADPDHHREAITSRPLLLHGIGRQTHHAGQTRLDGDVEPRTAGSGCRGLAADHRLLPDADAKCGAVERRGSLAQDPGGSAEEIPPGPPAGSSALDSAASTGAGRLKLSPGTGRSSPPTAGFRITAPAFLALHNLTRVPKAATAQSATGATI